MPAGGRVILARMDLPMGGDWGHGGPHKGMWRARTNGIPGKGWRVGCKSVGGTPRARRGIPGELVEEGQREGSHRGVLRVKES